MATCKNANKSKFITLHIKFNSRGTKDLKIKPDDLIEEKVRNSLELIITGIDFLNRLPLSLRPTIIGTSLKASVWKRSIVWTRWLATELETIFTNYTFEKGLVSKIYKKLKKKNKKNKNKQINFFKKWIWN